MSKKTLALILGLFLVTVVLIAVALNTSKPSTTPSQNQVAQQPSPTPYAHTVLSFSPDTVSASSTPSTVNVMIDSGGNEVTGVQLELAYDPTKITNVKVQPGTFFTNAFPMIDNRVTKKSSTETHLTYALVVPNVSQAKAGSGTVATITFRKAAGATGSQTMLSLLPITLVTAHGVAQSVLLHASAGVTVNLSSTGAATAQPY